jgi:hypothetical protein
VSLTTSRAELMTYASRDLASGTHAEDVVEMLVKNGMSDAEARQLVMSLGGALRENRASGALVHFGIGALLLALGAGATLVSYGMGGSRFYVMTGLLVAGVISIGRGAMRLLG